MPGMFSDRRYGTLAMVANAVRNFPSWSVTIDSRSRDSSGNLHKIENGYFVEPVGEHIPDHVPVSAGNSFLEEYLKLDGSDEKKEYDEILDDKMKLEAYILSFFDESSGFFSNEERDGFDVAKDYILTSVRKDIQKVKKGTTPRISGTSDFIIINPAPEKCKYLVRKLLTYFYNNEADRLRMVNFKNKCHIIKEKYPQVLTTDNLVKIEFEEKEEAHVFVGNVGLVVNSLQVGPLHADSIYFPHEDGSAHVLLDEGEYNGIMYSNDAFDALRENVKPEGVPLDEKTESSNDEEVASSEEEKDESPSPLNSDTEESGSLARREGIFKSKESRDIEHKGMFEERNFGA